MRIVRLVLAAAVAIALTGCPKKVTTAPDRQADANASTASTAPVADRSAAAGSQLSADQQALQELQRLGMVIYFDYDRSDIKPEFVSVLAAHAKYLNGAATRKVRLEGHTDERGSREYNIGLGERRAQQVRRALMLQGVTDVQVVTVSYGEERSAVSGSDESAYAKNRRVEISYNP